jgi:hypothetical protein
MLLHYFDQRIGTGLTLNIVSLRNVSLLAYFQVLANEKADQRQWPMTGKIKMVQYVRVIKDVRWSARCTCLQSEQI